MLGFADAIKLFYVRYADFSGRSSRSEYWWVQLLLWIALFLYYAALIGGIIAAGGLDADYEPSAGLLAFMGGVATVYGLFFLGSVIPAIALTVRRFHDCDMSGWHYLGFFIGFLIPVINIVAMIGIIAIFIQDGTPGVNQYGPDPLGRVSAETFD